MSESVIQIDEQAEIQKIIRQLNTLPNQLKAPGVLASACLLYTSGSRPAWPCSLSGQPLRADLAAAAWWLAGTCLLYTSRCV